MSKDSMVWMLVMGAGAVPIAHTAPLAPATSQATVGVPVIPVVQPETLISLKQCPTLVAALTLLERKTGAVFVVEGCPYRDTTLAAPPLTRSRLTTNSPLPLKEVVDEVARAYDYTASGGSLFLLCKRYGNADDAPEVTRGEIQRFLESASDLLRPFARDLPASVGINQRFVQFAQSLSAEQTALLRRDTPRPSEEELKAFADLQSRTSFRLAIPNDLPPNRFHEPGELPGGPISLLSFPQQQLLMDIGWKSFLGKQIDEMRHARNLVNALDTNSYFAAGQVAGHRTLMYHYREAETEYVSPFAPTSRIERRYGAAYVRHDPLSGPDSSDPQPSDYEKESPRPGNVETSETTVTLKRLASELNDKRQAGKSTPLYVVAPQLEDKRVTLIGTATTPTALLLHSIANLYNLSLETREDQIRLTLPRPPRITRFEELSPALLTIMPRPLLAIAKVQQQEKLRAERAAKAGRGVELPLLGPPPQEDPNAALEAMLPVEPGMPLHTRRERSDKAVRRLRVLIEPRLKTAASQRMGWKQLTEEEKTLTVWVMTSDALPLVYQLVQTRSLPTYLSKFHASRAIVFSEEVGDRRWLRVHLQGPRPDEVGKSPQTASSSGVIEALPSTEGLIP